jgi:hypothetical protein
MRRVSIALLALAVVLMVYGRLWPHPPATAGHSSAPAIPIEKASSVA